MAEYLLMGDIHLSDRAPSSCTDTYLDDMFTLLAEVGHIARERGSDGVIWAGDVFHHKTPGRTSHRTVITLIEIAHTYPCPVYVVPGNHDMLHDRLDSIHLSQPLGVVIASGAVVLLDGWMESPDGKHYYPVFGVPWLQDWSDTSVQAAYAEEYVDYDPPGHRLIVTHAPLYPPGQELVHEFYGADKYAEAVDRPHGTVSVYYGHVHEPHGIWRAGGVTFCNAGAASRGSLHEHNLTRKVQIAAWSSESGAFELLDVPHRPAAEVFRLKEADEIRTARVDLGNFIESVGSARLALAEIGAVMEHVRTLGLGPRLEQVIRELLEDADT